MTSHDLARAVSRSTPVNRPPITLPTIPPN
jgi:hypothetical protein